MAIKYTAKAKMKAAAIKLACTIIVHFTFFFMELKIEQLTKILFKSLKESSIITDVIQCIHRIIEDKFNIDKNLDLIHPLGTSQTHLEKYSEFASVVYNEQNKNTTKFMNLNDNDSSSQHNFMQMRKKYLDRMQKLVEVIQNEIFGKKGPSVIPAGEFIDVSDKIAS